MTITRDAAIDEMFGYVNSILTGSVATLLTYQPDTRWQNVQKPDPPDNDKYWFRTSQQTVISQQSTLSNDVQGGRRFTTNGLLFIQVFAPMSDPESPNTGGKIAAMLRDAFRAQNISANIWYRNAQVKELNPADSSFRFNVVTAFEYDEIG